MPTNTTPTNARVATLARLMETTIKVYFDPPPSADTVKNMLDDLRIPRFKTNPLAKRGGGPCYYSVPHVEKALRARTILKIANRNHEVAA